MKVHGACHCGRVSYEAEIDPAHVSLCNCTDCQVLSGSAFRITVPAPRAQFRLRGDPSIYVKTADSGAKRRHAFCSTCAAPIYACADVPDPPSYSLRVGGIKERAGLAARKRIWCRSALEWAQDVSGIPAVELQ